MWIIRRHAIAGIWRKIIKDFINFTLSPDRVGYAVAYWLKHYATSQKVVGSRPNEVKLFNLPNPSGSTRPWGSFSL
jgi:hypothetical protein